MRPRLFGATQALAALVLGMWSCASTTPGAQPHDMSAAEHESMAAGEADAAAQHAARYDVDAAVEKERCSRGSEGFEGPCWTSTTNPTAAHREEVFKHQRAAADHRAASQALGDAEARACVGISGEDRDMSPFEHREDIESVETLTEGVASGKAQYAKSVGAVIVLRALPGLTAQWLQRVIDCHLARNAALGHDVPEMPSCPLVPKGVTARVTPTEKGICGFGPLRRRRQRARSAAAGAGPRGALRAPID